MHTRTTNERREWKHGARVKIELVSVRPTELGEEGLEADTTQNGCAAVFFHHRALQISMFWYAFSRYTIYISVVSISRQRGRV